MNYEVEDFRKKQPLQDPGPWLTWAVPEILALRYLFRIGIWLYVVPVMLFGVQWTPLGIFVQYLIVDYVSYLQYKKINFF